MLIGRGQGEVGFECLMAWESGPFFRCSVHLNGPTSGQGRPGGHG